MVSVVIGRRHEFHLCFEQFPNFTSPFRAVNRYNSRAVKDPLPKAPSLSPELMDVLMGKSPLRTVAQRVKHVTTDPNGQNATYWIETLECGHEQAAFRPFRWDDGHLVNLEPTAKRRRCVECKAIAQGQKKPNQSVTLPSE